jgi:predicted dehydrogenase
MGISLNRREFMAATGMAMLAARRAHGDAAAPALKTAKVGFIGVGGRGTGLLKIFLALEGAVVPAICDINEEHLSKALDIVEKASGARPEGYSKGPYDYRRMLERSDLDAVLIATPPMLHAEMAVDAMNAGKNVGSEVPGAHTLKECWALVKTKEKTGRRYMLLENYVYANDRMMISNMMKQRVFGEPYYAECSYIHDCNSLRYNDDGSMTWRGERLLDGHANIYPTHALGPVSKWMDINKSDRFVSLVSSESKPGGIIEYVNKKFGPDSPQAKAKWECAGMSVTLIKTEKDRLITVYYDSISPRPMSIFYLIQGSKGVFDSRKGIFIDGVSPAEEWEPWQKYNDRYEHEYWKTRGEIASASGHGGGDYFSISDFAQMVREDREPNIDVYDSAAWSSVMPLSQESLRKGGKEVHFPDFTKNRA